MEGELAALEKRIEEIRAALEAKKAKEAAFMEKLEKAQQGFIELNVGGIRYTTSRATLARYPQSMLESLVSGRFATKTMHDGSVFIDRDGTHFGIILNAMRNGVLSFPPGFSDYRALASEVEFYQLPFKVPRARGNGPIKADFTREHLCQLLVTSTARKDFIGLRFCGLDLSGMRFDGASSSNGFEVRLLGCDFSGSTLSHARFQEVNFNQCSFIGADVTGAHFENCSMSDCEFDGADLSTATMIKCSLKQASFVEANLSGAHLTSCNLTGADLTRACLDVTNFTGSTLANANLKDVDTKTANWTQVTGVVLGK